VRKDETTSRLILSTPFYVVEHDLKAGGAIVRIHNIHGRADNLLAKPLALRVRFKDKSRVPCPIHFALLYALCPLLYAGERK
jgi:hypothetical protein